MKNSNDRCKQNTNEAFEHNMHKQKLPLSVENGREQHIRKWSGQKTKGNTISGDNNFRKPCAGINMLPATTYVMDQHMTSSIRTRSRTLHPSSSIVTHHGILIVEKSELLTKHYCDQPRACAGMCVKHWWTPWSVEMVWSMPWWTPNQWWRESKLLAGPTMPNRFGVRGMTRWHLAMRVVFVTFLVFCVVQSVCCRQWMGKRERLLTSSWAHMLDWLDFWGMKPKFLWTEWTCKKNIHKKTL